MTEPHGTGSPAASICAAAGIPSVLFSLNSSAYPIALFLAFVALVALPLALSDRPGPRLTVLSLLGAASAGVTLALVGSALLFGDEQQRLREAASALRGTVLT